MFKVPRLVPGFDKQGQVESTPDTGKSSRVVNDEIDNSPLSFSLVSRLDDSGSDSLSHSISVGTFLLAQGTSQAFPQLGRKCEHVDQGTFLPVYSSYVAV